MAPAVTTARCVSGSSTAPAEADERQRGLADFHQFYVTHAELVRRVVARLLGPGVDVDDAVQEVFLVAWRKRESFAGRAQPSTWLYAIARRVALATRRRTRLRRFFGLAAASEPVAELTPAQTFENRESSQRLYALLEQISDKKRTVLILHEVEGLPGEEIARVVGCPLKTVWTRLHHARRELQALAAGLDGRSRP
jgi:RNA polymerase sigma-70 factor (ECF subfamily)